MKMLLTADRIRAALDDARTESDAWQGCRPYIKYTEGRNMEPIYYATAAAARERGELDMYRASTAENRRTRDVIDAALAAHFDGLNLSGLALTEIIEQADPDRVALVLAVTMDDRNSDGRFTTDNRTWAAGIRIPDLAPDGSRFWYTCRTHSTILNGFARLFRTWYRDEYTGKKATL